MHVGKNWKGLGLQWKCILSLDVGFIIKCDLFNTTCLALHIFAFPRAWVISVAFVSFSSTPAHFIYTLLPVFDELTTFLWPCFLLSVLAPKFLQSSPTFHILSWSLNCLGFCLFNALFQYCASGFCLLCSLLFFLYSVCTYCFYLTFYTLTVPIFMSLSIPLLWPHPLLSFLAHSSFSISVSFLWGYSFLKSAQNLLSFLLPVAQFYLLHRGIHMG